MPTQPKLTRFNQNVLSKYQIYNSIFMTLPFDTISKTVVLLPLFYETCKSGFEKKEEVSEAEDSLVIMLDVMTRLIEEEKNTGSEQAKELQAKLLWKYLVPFSEKLTEACRVQESAEFYQACSAFYVGYLDLEKRRREPCRRC